MDAGSAPPDLFEAEHRALQAARDAYGDSAAITSPPNQALGGLLTAYERLLRETRRLVQRSDRTEREMSELNQRLQELARELEYRATHDPLTGVLNRAAIIDRVNLLFQKQDLALIVLDIDHFKRVNDSFGHPVGDRVIVGVVACLKRAVPAAAFVGRVGGEEFTVLLATQDGRYAEEVAESVRRAIEAHVFALPDGSRITASFGVSWAPCGGSFDDAYALADEALYTAKRGGRNQVARASGRLQGAHDDTGTQATQARARDMLHSDLRAAIDDGLLFLVYQPQVDLISGALIGLEALSRWRTREGLFVPPDEFIPVAEHSGLIVALGRWVLFTACQTMRRLLDGGVAPQRMAVNVSMVQLRDPGFFAMVCLALAGSGLHGRHIELEVTESVAVLPTQQLEATLNSLRGEGISIAIDDFGTGYSSLSCLERLPLDRIKIDRAFVSQLGKPQGARIAEMVAQLGHKLGLQVLAEGIEDAATCQALLAIGAIRARVITSPCRWTKRRCSIGWAAARLRAVRPPVASRPCVAARGSAPRRAAAARC